MYDAADDLERCIDSVLAHSAGDYRLILIDDASPDPAISAYFDALARRGISQLVLLKNERNLGFTLNANRGMRAARPQSDVVLLNSDTVVTSGWLAALARCAQSDSTIGTVTPFSNNAEICSLPRFCQNNPWPVTLDTEPMVEALARAAVPTYPDLPTGVGFCFYIRRALLDAIGVFDPAFGLGYGEENDYCLRAVGAGFRNVLCEDAFVLHTGGSSFGDKRSELAERNMKILLERHPGYLDLVLGYIAADPIRPLREFALSQYRLLTDSNPGVLHIIHGHGGGTEYHVRSLIAETSTALRHFLLIAVGEQWRFEEHDAASRRCYEFRRGTGESWSDLLGGLCSRFGVDLIHVHNISGCREGLLRALAGVDVPYGYTVHDLNFACPTITLLDARHTYCGAVTDPAVCRACLAAQPAFAGVDIEHWRNEHRSVLARAAFVIAPSKWAGATLNKYFPECRVDVIAHGREVGPVRDPRSDAVRTTLAMPDDDTPVVAVLGAIGPDKGARRLERLVELTRERGLRIRWVLIGYLDRGREPWQSADGVFTMHGPYDVNMLPALIEHYRVRLVAYPSAGPETFSFTLSEVWALGRPAIVPPVGALADRVGASGGGWVWSEEEWRSEERMLDRIARVLDPTRRDEFAGASERALAAPQTTIAAMATATVATYGTALKKSTGETESTSAPIAAQRCVEALGYVPWHPPKPRATVSAGSIATNGAHEPTPAVLASTAEPTSTMSTSATAPGVLEQLARAALRIRHTPTGRVLYRLAPASLLAVLKDHLPR